MPGQAEQKDLQYLTVLDLQTDAFGFVEDVFNVQFHGKLIDVLQQIHRDMRIISDFVLDRLWRPGLTFRISLKPKFSSMIFCFSESRMAQQTSRWKF